MLTVSSPPSLSRSSRLWLVEFCDRPLWELPLSLTGETQIITPQEAIAELSILSAPASVSTSVPIPVPELLLLSSGSWTGAVAAFCRQLNSIATPLLPPALLLYDSSQQPNLELAFSGGIYDCIDVALPEPLLLQRIHSAVQYHRLHQQAQAWQEQEQQLKAQLGRIKTRLEQFRRQDEITQLLNRSAFEEALELAWRLHIREQKELCLILLELGYEAMDWDEVPHSISTHYLREVGPILQEQLKRPGDVACRYREKQIMLLLPNTTHGGALQLMRSLDVSLRLELEATSGLSFAAAPVWQHGLASAKPLPGDSASLLVEKVQQALVTAKDRQSSVGSDLLY